MKSLLATAALVAIAGVSPAWALGNPASAYCTSVGGRLEIRKDAKGEAGYCHLPDGRVVEEWQLFREVHKAKP